jgi:transcriptional regulator with XRE-family HTH domain
VEIFERLREERKRLGLSQAEFAAKACVHFKSQANYEKGDRAPDAAYLTAIAAAGADVLYILTGERKVQAGVASTADSELLAEVIKGVELLLKKTRKTLPAEEKAWVITRLYNDFAAQRPIEPDSVRQMIEQAA